MLPTSTSVLLCCGLAGLAGAALAQDTPIKVACIGDSITFGAGVEPRDRSNYPAILGALLGDGYHVRNFGLSAATLLSAGDLPYEHQEVYADALAFEPDVVVIKLGTNDTKPQNWAHKDEFAADYWGLVESLWQLDSKPRVLLCLPVPAVGEVYGISGERIEHELVPRLRSVAYELELELIDLHSPFRYKTDLLPDGVHPNAFGAEIIAQNVYETLTFVPADRHVELPKKARVTGEGEFWGYDRTDFEYRGRACHLVHPRRPAEGLPWVWRARFFGWEPQVDRALLQRGFHIAYCDVAGLYGSPEAVAVWDEFYGLTQQIGLHPKPILEACSRGGLIAYNWASESPEKISAIYGHGAVMDIRSWPGGKGMGKGAETEWAECLACYGLDEAAAETFGGIPLNGLAPLAEAGVPLIHYAGLADEVVPFEENTAIAAERYAELGGHMKVVGIEGMGHHPATYGTDDFSEVIDFLLDATSRKVSYPVVPAPNVEFRGQAAGWGGGTWWDQFDALNELAIAHGDEIDLLFLGDSITQSWTGAGNRLATPDGERLFDRMYGDYGAASFGISGDRTEHLLYRIGHGNLDGLSPKVIVLMIGVNNIVSTRTDGAAVLRGTLAIVDELRSKCPETRILLPGSFPCGLEPGTWERDQVAMVHEGLAQVADGDKLHYLDLRHLFLAEDGTANPDTMAGDGIHLTSEGYRAWAESMQPLLLELLAN